MADKDFKTIDEQIEILRSRGLTIEDEAEAKDFLLRNNYYRVSGYSLTLRKNDVFAKSATFQNIEDIYNFDHEFRHIILHHIETIEVQMKSIYAYEFTKVYGPLGYLDAANFSNQAKHKEIVDKANQQKRQRLNDVIPSDRRATLISVDSMAYSLLMIPASPLVGLVGDLTGQAGAGLCVLCALVVVSGLAAAGKTRYNGRGA